MSRGMLVAVLVACILFLTGAIGLLFGVFYGTDRRGEGSGFGRASQVIAAGASSLASDEAEARKTRDDVAVSVRFDLHGGMPFVDLRVDGQRVRCVPDTGSRIINIASSDCEGCAPKHQGSLQVGAGAGVDAGTVHYDTQRDDVRMHVGSVEMGTRKSRMPFHVTVRRTTVSDAVMNLNVCGLLDASRGGEVVPRLFPATHVFGFAFDADGSGGRLFSVPRDHAAAQRRMYSVTVPWNRSPSCGGDMHYVVALAGIVAEDAAGAVCHAANIGGGHGGGSDVVKYAIIDTGSNTSSVPPAMHECLLPHLARNATLRIQFVCGVESQETCGLRLPFANYRYLSKPRGPFTLTDDTAALPAHTALLGAPAFRGYTVLFHPEWFGVRPTSAVTIA